MTLGEGASTGESPAVPLALQDPGDERRARGCGLVAAEGRGALPHVSTRTSCSSMLLQPNVHTSNCAIRSKSLLEISRAWAANSSAAIRLRSRSSSLMGATLASSSSWACSTLEIIASKLELILSRAKSSAPQSFATERSTHRSGTSESIAKYVSPAACMEQWLVLKSLITVLNHLTIFFFISDAP